MTAISGSSLTTVGFVGESNERRSSSSIFHVSSRLPLQIPRAVKTRSDGGADLLRKPPPAISRPENRSDKVIVDWEDQILAETVPIVNFARMILHSGRYKSGERLSGEHEKGVREKLLPYHPEYERKIEGGISHIKVGYHPEFENTRCMLVVWKNGVEIDFSYWKCVKGLIRTKFPIHAEGFILRHLKHRHSSRPPTIVTESMF